jgi:hypothetical protein
MKLSGVLTIKKDAKESGNAQRNTVNVLSSPLDSRGSPTQGFTLLHGDVPSPKYLMKIYSEAAADNNEVNLITVTVPVFQFPPEVAVKVAGSLDKLNFLQAEHLRIANISKDLRNDIVNRLIVHYEEINNLAMVEKLAGVSSSMGLNQLCATEPGLVDVMWNQNEHLAVISHYASVGNIIQEVSTMYRGGLDCTIVNRHGRHQVSLPEICNRPILSIIRERANSQQNVFSL